MQSPNFDTSKITPEDYQVVAKYVPQAAPYIAEHAPQTVQYSDTGKQGMDAQLQALQGLKGIASQQYDPQMQAKIMSAQQAAGAQANSSNQSALQQMQRRGSLNSGVGMAATLQGNSAAADRAASSGQDAAVQSYLNKIQAMKDSANLGGSIAGQDAQMQGQNAQYMNQFYTRQQQGQQAQSNLNVGNQNQAQQMNNQQAQQTANQNVGQHNQYQQRNQEYGNQMAQQGFQNNQNIAQGRAGQAVNQSNLAMQGAQQNNQAIQGAANAGMGGLQYYQQDQRQNQQHDDNQAYISAVKGMRQNAPFANGGY